MTHNVMPARVAALPVNEAGYPIPWFVAEIDGVPDFRVISPGKIAKAHRDRRCFICGVRITGPTFAFVVGPMCAVNRVSVEPPSHRECAKYAAMACPFLVNPKKRRRKSGMEGTYDPGGIMLDRNPGVALVWITRSYAVEHARGVIFRMGPASRALWFCEGREATRGEVDHSIETGLPILRSMAEAEGLGAVLALDAQVARLDLVLPKEDAS